MAQLLSMVYSETKKENTMKTKTLFITGLLIAAFLVSPAISNANSNDASAETSTTLSADFTKSLSRTIKYPVKASENQIEGTIWVSIDVNDQGIMSVEQSNHSCCEKLHNEVVDQLDGKKIKNFKESMVGTHNLKLTFEIEK